jgi:hypothetical protein
MNVTGSSLLSDLVSENCYKKRQKLSENMPSQQFKFAQEKMKTK